MGIIAFNCKYVCTIFCIVYRILFYLFRFKIIFHLTLAAITTSIFFKKKKRKMSLQLQDDLLRFTNVSF